ncbi:MAG: prephenate dehydratase [Nitrospiraceae bacterium]|nr:prephenate dehydratase [Nitrospiraceae bacterium]|tara:strand:- start:64 stop:1146 length:1083 start_codon:yes stop_codon:yes gene_type:complete
MPSLESYRSDIDRIDDQILRLLGDRAKAVIAIGAIKMANGEGVNLHTANREAKVFERLFKNNPGPYPNEAIRHVFREIMSASLCLEGPIKVAYLGPKGTFTHLAGIRKLGSSAEYIPIHSIKGVFQEVCRGQANFGIVPVENSTEGVVNHTLDMFFESSATIYGEISQEISHHFLSKATTLDEIKTIYSHPHAIAQCRNWIEDNIPGPPVIDVFSTGRAAELAAEDPTTAAIASELAAKIYGLNIMEKHIEGHLNNYTRFLVLSNHAPERTRKSKTSLMIYTKDRPGGLCDLLRPFATHGINLTRVESRPSRQKAWEYVFFIDIEGHIDDELVTKTIHELETQTLGMKLLGSYPAEEHEK